MAKDLCSLTPHESILLVSNPMQVVKCEVVRAEQHLLSAAREEKGDMAALSALMS